MKKRIFAALLVFIMTLSLLPSNALAVDVPAEYRPTIEWTKDLAVRDHSLTVEVVHEGNSLGTTSSTAKHLSATVKLSNDSIEVYDSEATGGSYSRSTFKLFTFAGTEGHLKLYTRSTAGHKVTVNYVFNDESGRTKASVEKQVKYQDKETFALAEDHYNCTIRVTSGDAKAEKDTFGRLAVTGGTQDSVVTVTYTPENNYIYIDKYFDNGTIFSKWNGENIKLNGYEFVENNKLAEKSVIANSDLTPAMEDYRFLTVTNNGSVTVYDFSYAVMIPKPFDETNMKLTDVWYDRDEGHWYYSHLDRKGLIDKVIVGNEGGINFCYNTVHSKDSAHHLFNQLVGTVDPTCTEGGYSLYQCAYCEKTEQRDQTAALNHNWGSWTHDAATTGAESTHTRTCKRDASHTETGSCNFIENDGTYTCSECGYSYGTYTLTYEWSGLPDGTTDPALPAAVNNLSNGEYTLADGFSSSSTATVNGTKYQFSGWKIKETDTAVNGTVTIAGASIILTGTWTPKDPGTVTIKLSDYIKKDLTVTGSGFQGETFTVTVKEDDGKAGCITGKVTYAADESGEKDFIDWQVVTQAERSDYYTFNNDGTITFKKKYANGMGHAFTVEETNNKTAGMYYDDGLCNLVVHLKEEDGKLSLNGQVQAITLENHYNGTFRVPLGQYIKKVYRSECGCTPETSFQFGALIKEHVAVVNALSLTEAAPAAKKANTYTATGSVTLKAGVEQTVDMSIDLPVGSYEVTLKEVNDGVANVSYDKTVYTFTISVYPTQQSGDAEISFSDVKRNAEYYDFGKAGYKFVFTNSYKDSHYIPVNPTPVRPALNTDDHYAYVVGYPDGTVRPNGTITRAEVSTILFRLLSDKTREEYFTTESSFTDVKAGAWYNNSVATLEKAGVIVDTAKGGAFRPDEAITRAELAAMLAQFSDAKPVKGVKFSDVPADHWAYDAIAIAAKMGWIEGYPDGTFRPDATITRAEMMTLVNRALERVPAKESRLLPYAAMLTFPDCQPGQWYYIAIQEATNSHTYERAVTEKNGDEQWIALRANRDWTLLEK